MACTLDFTDDNTLTCLSCRSHVILVGYAFDRKRTLRDLAEKGLLRGRALAEVSGAAEHDPACRPSAGSPDRAPP